MNKAFYAACLMLLAVVAQADEKPAEPAAKFPPLTVPGVPLNKQGTVFIDIERKTLHLKSSVCLREGVLEMLLCLKKTKEHESIVSIDSDAVVIHAGLLALGAVPGKPARFDEKYTPPTGQEIEIFVRWRDPRGQEQRRPAQEWVRHVTHKYFSAPLAAVPKGVAIDKGDDSLRYDPAIRELLYFGTMSEKRLKEFQAMSTNEEFRKSLQSLHDQGQPREMKAKWVFAGSAFSTTRDGEQWYQAQAGNVICVANFGDAMIDVSIQSSGNNSNLLFEPYTERLPPIDTEVIVELKPVLLQNSGKKTPAAVKESTIQDEAKNQ